MPTDEPTERPESLSARLATLIAPHLMDTNSDGMIARFVFECMTALGHASTDSVLLHAAGDPGMRLRVDGEEVTTDQILADRKDGN